MQLIHQMKKSANRNVFLYSFLSVTFGLGHRLPGAGVIRMVGNSILCVHVCVSEQWEWREVIVSRAVNIQPGEVKGQATEKYKTLMWAQPVSASELIDCRHNFSARHFLNVT